MAEGFLFQRETLEREGRNHGVACSNHALPTRDLNMKKSLILILFISFIFISGISSCQKEQSNFTEICINECMKQKNQINLSSQCILDPIPNSDYVCDIAHSPRQAADNLPENQCNAWHNKTAEHFIEVTPDCEFIRAM